MSITQASDAYMVLPDDETLTATVVALEEHGFSVEVVPDLDAAREAVLARIPEGSVVMTNTRSRCRRPASRPRSTTAARTSRRATRCWRSTSRRSCKR